MAKTINPSAFFAEIQNRENEPKAEEKEQTTLVKSTKKRASATESSRKAEKGAETRQPYTIYLPENVRKKLEEERFKTKKTFSDIIEQVLKNYFSLPH